MITEIVGRIKDICDENDVQEPNIFSEFGSFTVAESGATFFSIHRPEEAEREGTLEHDRRQLHDHATRYMGHQQALPHAAHQQLER